MDHSSDALTRFQNALDVIAQEVGPGIPLGVAQLFIAISLSDKPTTDELNRRFQRRRSTLSRQLLDLGPKSSKGTAGYELIDWSSDAQDLRIKRWSLTSAGVVLAKKVAEALKTDG
jgi:DNA-binding MarR family transcriptional regulator